MFWSLVAMAVIVVYVGFALIAARNLFGFRSLGLTALPEADEDLLSGLGPGTLIRPQLFEDS